MSPAAAVPPARPVSPARAEPAARQVFGRRRNRDDVVRTAGRMFAQRGFHGTSMRDLGEALGLLGSSLYAHIGSKNELLVEVIHSGAEQFLGLAESVAGAGLAPSARLERLVAGHVRILSENADRAATFLNEARHLPEADRAQVLAWRHAYQEVFRTTLAEGVADGSFAPQLDVARTATLVLSLLNAVERWYHPGGSDDVDSVARHLTQFIQRGIQP